MIRIVFLGKLADLAECAELEVTSASGKVDWDSLLALLEERLNPAIASAASEDKTKLAINGTLLADKLAMAAGDGDEVAFLPPVSGG